jgi:carbon-monoxide dehydrogenase medium subunit
MGHAWFEIARRHGDYALVGVAAVLTLREDGACDSARLVYTGVAPVPFDARESAELLVGEQPSDGLFAEAAEHAARASEPGSDVHASSGYRRHLVGVLTRWALAKALERASREDRNGA